MTDAAIGGKTAIDLPAGKNLVGAFHQPQIVSCNLATLATLPERERRAGFGELWKYALLDGPGLWRAVDACAAAAQPTRDVLERAIAYKAAIVGRDERETGGQRALLNLGHTIGHAIEVAAGYGTLRHGEAVSIGMAGALRLSGNEPLREQVVALSRQAGLPVKAKGLEVDTVLDVIRLDKKRVGDTVPFVLVNKPGDVTPGHEIPADELEAAVRELLR
jgi:3-dehydroquinate synthetase